MIEQLIGDGARDFRRGATWPDRAALYRSTSDWFPTIAALPIFTDPEEWLDRAPELHPPAFKRRDDISEPVLNRATGVLTWCQAGNSRECSIPAWAHAVCERIIDTRPAWSILTLHDAVDSDDVPFLNLLVSQLKEAGFLEQVPAASGGVATR